MSNKQQSKQERLAQRYMAKHPPMPGKGGPGVGPRGGRGMLASGKPKNTKATLRRLFAYLRRDRLKIATAVGCMLVSSVTSIIGTYLLRPVINFIAPVDGSPINWNGFVQGLVFMGLIYVFGIAAQYLQSRIMIGVSQRALHTIRNELFHKVQKLPIRFYDAHNHGELMSRFTNDVDVVGEVLNHTILSLISGVIHIIGMLIMMFYTNVWLTLITLVFVPLVAKAGAIIANKSRRYFIAQQSAIGALNGYIEETVSGQKVVKVFCHEEECKEEFGILNDDLREKQIKAHFFGGIMGPVLGNLGQINYALTASVGGVLCITAGFDVGGLTVFANASRQFNRPVNEIAMQMNTIFSALAGAERVFAIMDEPEEEMTPDGEELQQVKGEVKLEHVTFGYVPEKTVLKDITLTAQPGQKIAFVGSTGAGKTTITNLINRFYEINEGNIFIDGTNIQSIQKESLRKNIAMVLQDTHLFTGTVMENIRYGRLDATDEEVIEAAKIASAHSFIMRLSDGYQTMLQGDGVNLSQGQRQLLNIARAAISKAPILVLDEATSSVDTRTERHIEHGMDRLMKNRTTFVIAHRLSTVRNADEILVLEHGVIIERGTHKELLEQQGRYYELYTGKAELD